MIMHDELILVLMVAHRATMEDDQYDCEFSTENWYLSVESGNCCLNQRFTGDGIMYVDYNTLQEWVREYRAGVRG